ncbi:MAG: 30S ribosomal protein S20 [Candidatus Falkowbacteria bacterium]|nr:30S ribosomal protein S20 [Candidatus Falkowbacteria bacterium]
MPNKQSAKKELRKGNRKALYNAKVKDTLKKLIKKSGKAIIAQDTKAKELVTSTLKALDKAIKNGILKKNTANRKKASLQKKLNTPVIAPVVKVKAKAKAVKK